MMSKCHYCNHSRAFHHKDGCNFKIRESFPMNDEDFCDCMEFTEVKESYLMDGDGDDN